MTRLRSVLSIVGLALSEETVELLSTCFVGPKRRSDRDVWGNKVANGSCSYHPALQEDPEGIYTIYENQTV